MDYRLTRNDLMVTLEAWDGLIGGRKKIHLIACGGTALTLLGYKGSTKDVDFLVPNEKEYLQLIQFLRRAGYYEKGEFSWARPGDFVIYDLYPGKRVYTTELLSSPLARGGSRKIRKWKRIFLGVLNSMDLVISKLFRGSGADFDDCLELARREKMDLKKLERRIKETAKYDVSEERVLRNFSVFMKQVRGRRR